MADFATLVQFSKFSMTVKSDEYVSASQDPSGWEHMKWRVQVRYERRSYTLDYNTGMSHSEPALADVVYSLLSDTSGYENCTGFYNWADDYGYDVEDPAEERKHRRTYRAVERQATALRRLLGSDFSMWLDDSEWSDH